MFGASAETVAITRNLRKPDSRSGWTWVRRSPPTKSARWLDARRASIDPFYWSRYVNTF
jgi:hypothetical protein